jgi:hypothetical protein
VTPLHLSTPPPGRRPERQGRRPRRVALALAAVAALAGAACGGGSDDDDAGAGAGAGADAGGADRLAGRLALVSLPGSRLAFKDTTPPRELAAHTGCWQVEPAGPGTCVVRVDHQVVPGQVAGPADAASRRTREERARRAAEALGRAVLDRLATLPAAAP